MTETKIAIIGLGYVGLPLAIEFGKLYETIGFDINNNRIKELLNGQDSTFEVTSQEMSKSKRLCFTNNAKDIQDCNTFIVTVPTPIDSDKKPDLMPLVDASSTVGKYLKKEDIVIYESTVYPGATEEVCVPVLEKYSGLIYNKDFYCGYSPERINPGDKKHRITMIKKITSGSTIEIADKVDKLYKKIITAGTHKVRSIKIAEAAKVIENTQRDVNIALINEFAIIFNKLEIDTTSVLEAAATKWNFLSFSPGLVGGHCIGVDPYYLTHKSNELGYEPQIILAGRNINNNMGKHVADKVFKLMKKKDIKLDGANILIMGLTFKENCPDLRNSGVFDLIESFKICNCNVEVYDPLLKAAKVQKEFNIKLVDKPENGKYDKIVLSVSHDEFKKLSIEEIKSYGAKKHILYDIKSIFDESQVDGRL